MASFGLKDHQLDALQNMHNGCILCGGVGSGKTKTALAYYYILNGGKIEPDSPYTPMDDPPKDLYIITTAITRDKGGWQDEMIPFLIAPGNNIYSNNIVVDSWNNIKKYADVENAFFIFDEQRVVGYGEWSKTFIKIAKANQWILLSATPGDSWSDYIPVFIANGFYKNKTDFVRQHIIYKSFTNFPQIDRYINDGRLLRLRNKILVNMDFKRHTVKHHEYINTEYDISKYKDVIKNRWNPFTDMPIDNASEFCQVLRKIVNTDITRQLALMEIMEDHNKAIIFYNYDYELDILRGLFYGCGVTVAEWNGHKHEPIPEDSKKWVYLVQYNSNEGWNCIVTNAMIFYSQTYSYKTMIQAAGRIDRFNTPYTNLYYYHLTSKSSIDISIDRALANKKKFNETKFVGGFA